MSGNWTYYLVMIASLFSVGQAIFCWQCQNARDINDCNKIGSLEECPRRQDTCETYAFRSGLTNPTYTINKKCRSFSSCKNKQNRLRKRKMSGCNDDKTLSYCTCCCQSDGCNVNSTCKNAADVMPKPRLASIETTGTRKGRMCWDCRNAISIADCNARGRLVQCRGFQDTCETFVFRRGLTNAEYKVEKKCRSASSCRGKQDRLLKRKAKWLCNTDKYKSFCNCCCQGENCNQAEQCIAPNSA